MKGVHYFQRFSRREDVVTNNTLLLLSRLQQENFRVFEELLRGIVADEQVVVGAQITQQETAPSRRIADGVLRQRGFHVVVETKLGPDFNTAQLIGHLSHFDGAGVEGEVLLLLAPVPPAGFEALTEVVQQRRPSVRVAACTFAALIAKARDAIPDHQRVLLDLLDDFEDFCDEERLLPRSDADLLIVGCSRTLPENRELGVYYDSKRMRRDVSYVGFYHDKAVRAVGRVGRIVQVERNAGQLVVHDGEPLVGDEETRIARAMDSAKEHGWDIERGCHFVLTTEVAPTLYRKHTKYPLWNRRYADLREVLGIEKGKPLPALDELARLLADRTW